MSVHFPRERLAVTQLAENWRVTKDEFSFPSENKSLANSLAERLPFLRCFLQPCLCQGGLPFITKTTFSWSVRKPCLLLSFSTHTGATVWKTPAEVTGLRQGWWYMPITPGFERLYVAEIHDIPGSLREASLVGYIIPSNNQNKGKNGTQMASVCVVFVFVFFNFFVFVLTFFYFYFFFLN